MCTCVELSGQIDINALFNFVLLRAPLCSTALSGLPDEWHCSVEFGQEFGRRVWWQRTESQEILCAAHSPPQHPLSAAVWRDWRRISGPPPMLLPTSCLGWNIYSANARVYPNPFPWWTSSMMDLVQRRRWFSTGSPIQRLTRRTRATGRLVATCWMPSCPTLISPATKLQLFTLQPL